MDINLIKQLREETGAGVNSVSQALNEAQGDLEKARDILRKQGLKVAEKKQGRQAADGLIDVYIHPPGKLAALVVLACETDFVARNEEFKTLAHELAKQAAAMSAKYLKPEDIPAELLEKEKEIYRAQLKKEGKPENVWEKIMEGKLRKFCEQVCLLEQPWIIDDKKKVKDLITEATAKLGEKIEVKEFARFEL